MKYNKIIKEEYTQIITEKLAEIDDDVDLIYDMFFGDKIYEIERSGSVKGINFDLEYTNTGILQSDTSKNVHKLNPCNIFINNPKYLNAYSPYKQIIGISAPLGAYEFAMDFNGDLLKASKNLSNDRIKRNFLNEFTEARIKGSINHELAHWIDDTLHNKSVKKWLDKAQRIGKKVAQDGKGHYNTHYIELEGQMNNIKQFKRQIEKTIYDKMSFDDLIRSIPTLSLVRKDAENKSMDNRLKWERNLKKRMAREGLLGKNMR